MKNKVELAVLAALATLLGILVSVKNLTADFVTKETFEERKENVEAKFRGVQGTLEEIKDEQKEFRRETNRKLDALIRRQD